MSRNVKFEEDFILKDSHLYIEKTKWKKERKEKKNYQIGFNMIEVKVDVSKSLYNLKKPKILLHMKYSMTKINQTHEYNNV